jgi:hypothetical protein
MIWIRWRLVVALAGAFAAQERRVGHAALLPTGSDGPAVSSASKWVELANNENVVLFVDSSRIDRTRGGSWVGTWLRFAFKKLRHHDGHPTAPGFSQLDVNALIVCRTGAVLTLSLLSYDSTGAPQVAIPARPRDIQEAMNGLAKTSLPYLCPWLRDPMHYHVEP